MSSDAQRDALLAKLRDLAESGDPEIAHYDADCALLDYIGDSEIAKAYEAIQRWYA